VFARTSPESQDATPTATYFGRPGPAACADRRWPAGSCVRAASCPPALCWPGVRPSHAPNCRPLRKMCASGTVAASVPEVTRQTAKQFAGASRDVTAAGVSGDRWSQRASRSFSAASCSRTFEIRFRSHDANRSALDQHRKHCTCCAKSRYSRKDDRRMAGNIDDAADDRFADAGEHV